MKEGVTGNEELETKERNHDELQIKIIHDM